VAPENTVEAFRAAARLGADAVELDARRSVDGAVVVHHDPTLEGDPLIEMTLAEINAAAPDVPTLGDALAACDGMWVDIEVKNNPAEPDWDPDDHTLGGVVEIVEGLDMAERVMVSSFNLPTVERAMGAGLRTGWLLPRSVDPMTAFAQWPTSAPAFVLPSLAAMGPEAAEQVVDAFGRLEVEVGVWTVNEPGEMRRLSEAGVGILFTDDVALAVETLG
jgi:glycerophosphoryl diester phosphodiesterase